MTAHTEEEVYSSLTAASTACWLTQEARKVDVVRESQVYNYKGSSVDMAYTPLKHKQLTEIILTHTHSSLHYCQDPPVPHFGFTPLFITLSAFSHPCTSTVKCTQRQTADTQAPSISGLFSFHYHILFWEPPFHSLKNKASFICLLVPLTLYDHCLTRRTCCAWSISSSVLKERGIF